MSAFSTMWSHDVKTILAKITDLTPSAWIPQRDTILAHEDLCKVMCDPMSVNKLSAAIALGNEARLYLTAINKEPSCVCVRTYMQMLILCICPS